ncbi:hypothetical protein PENTCL1PPCAC_25628, partial [Pristionchus entomophagus]
DILRILLVVLSVDLSSSLSIEDVLKTSTKTRPENKDGGPLQVHIGIYLESIGNFRSTEMSFEVDLYVYMSWRDRRLTHNHTDHVLINDEGIRKQMWLPDLYFANARQATFQDVTVPNFNMFVAQDGTVAYSCRATCSISCSLKLVNYPMDHQHCYIRVLSYAHVAEQVSMQWFHRDPIRHNHEIGLPEFQISNVSNGYCNGTYRYALTDKSHKIGNFSCLMANIFLSRSIGYNLVQSYIPTGLIVMISWVSFWIDRRAVPARVTLSFTTLVSLTTLGNGLRFGLPQVSYAKAIDLWYGACMFFVFCALLEFALINSHMRKSEKYDHISKTFATSPRYRNLMEKLAAAPTFNDIGNGRLGNGRGHHEDGKGFGTRKRFGHNGINTGEDKPIMYRQDEVSRSPQRAPVLNGVKRNGKPLLSSVNEDDDGMNYMKDEKNEEVPPFPRISDIHTNPQTESFSAVSVYDNVTPVRKPMDSFGDEETEIVLASDSEEEALERKFRQFRQASARRRKSGYTANTSTFYTTLSIEASRTALKIDKACRYLFPGGFLAFNLFYWWYYLVYKNNEGEFATDSM